MLRCCLIGPRARMLVGVQLTRRKRQRCVLVVVLHDELSLHTHIAAPAESTLGRMKVICFSTPRPPAITHVFCTERGGVDTSSAPQHQTPTNQQKARIAIIATLVSVNNSFMGSHPSSHLLKKTTHTSCAHRTRRKHGLAVCCACMLTKPCMGLWRGQSHARNMPLGKQSSWHRCSTAASPLPQRVDTGAALVQGPTKGQSIAGRVTAQPASIKAVRKHSQATKQQLTRKNSNIVPGTNVSSPSSVRLAAREGQAHQSSIVSGGGTLPRSQECAAACLVLEHECVLAGGVACTEQHSTTGSSSRSTGARNRRLMGWALCTIKTD